MRPRPDERHMIRRLTTAWDAMTGGVHRHQRLILGLLILTHLVMAALHTVGRLTYGGVPQTVTAAALESPAWPLLSLAAAVWLAVWHNPPRVLWGLHMSAVTLAAWGTLSGYVGITAGRPVMLTGPALALILAGLSRVSVSYWRDTTAEL